MYLASAYPNPALSALTMMAIGLVVAASLAAWLGLVFLADHRPRQASGNAALAQPDGTAEDENSGLAEHHVARGNRAA
jgi:hypothetical protein